MTLCKMECRQSSPPIYRKAIRAAAATISFWTFTLPPLVTHHAKRKNAPISRCDSGNRRVWRSLGRVGKTPDVSSTDYPHEAGPALIQL